MKLFDLYNLAPKLQSRFPAGITWVDTEDRNIALNLVKDECDKEDPTWLYDFKERQLPEGIIEIPADCLSGKVEVGE